MARSFYWHDYETWGADPRRDRPAQFAGVRSDEALECVSEPLVLYCRPADDMLPQPEACLITGITPQRALAEGVCEAEFTTRVHAELARPGTCGTGYNSIRFDDEVTRHSLYRNFFDPYAREWQNGNSRWDLIDSVRLTHALRPQGIVWPERAPGVTSFRLEDLSAANGIAHESAHDALSDVYATLDLARLLRRRQPRLFDYALSLRDKRRVAGLLDLRQRRVVLHVSEKFPAELGCIAPVLPLARYPGNKNGIVVYDLRQDPAALLELDAETLHARVFTPVAELPQGQERLRLKTVHVNRCPVLAPTGTLTGEAAERWQIDLHRAERHAETLRANMALVEEKVRTVHSMKRFPTETDPDRMLYAGGFFGDADRRAMARLREMAPAELGTTHLAFEDERLPEMLFRYRGRNWPQSLSEPERSAWESYRRRRLSDPAGGASLGLAEYRQRLAQLRGECADDRDKRALLDELEAWGDRLETW